MDLESHPLRLRPDASIEVLPGGADFWPRVMSGAFGNFHHEYLVTTGSYDADWRNWERHPAGDEIVLLLSGRATFVLELPGGPREQELSRCGEFLKVPRGTWHTARVASSATLLFITAGEGTEGRPA